MQPKTHRIQGYVLIATGMLLLVPTIHEIRMSGFDSGMIPVVLSSATISLSCMFNFCKARAVERKQKNKKRKITTPGNPETYSVS